MTEVTLYCFPLSCARVAMVALEKAGVAFDCRIINIVAGEQNSPEYLKINPAGKVPALQIGGHVLTENVAIILYLDQTYPQASLLPRTEDPLKLAAVRADLIWCATTLHPMLRQIRATRHYTVGDTDPVKAKAIELIRSQFAALDQRFARQPWWYGDAWSIMDTYVNWISAGYAIVGGDLSDYPALCAHDRRVVAEPAYRRMFEREGRSMEQAGVQLPPGVVRC